MRASAKVVVVFTMLVSAFITTTTARPVGAISTTEFVPGTFWANTARTGFASPTIAYGNGAFVVGGDGSAVSHFIATSTDGETFTNRKTMNWTITSYQRINNEVTITTLADHLLSVGERFSFTDPTLSTTLGASSCVCAVTSLPTPTSFTFQLAGSDLALSSGSWANDRRNSAGAKVAVFGGPPGSEVFLVGMTAGYHKVWSSSDNGATWSPVVSGGINGDRSIAVWTSATYGAGKFVALTGTAAHRIIYSSDNGSTWLTATVPAADQSSLWESVTYGGGKFVAVASSGTNRVMTSTDGVTWTSGAAASGGESNAWKKVAFGSSVFMAVANSGTDRVMTSTDGISWTLRSVSAYPTAAWSSVTWAGTAFVLGATPVSGNSVVVSTKDAGATWIPVVDAIGGGGGAFNNTTLSAMAWNGTFLLGMPSEATKAITKSVSPGTPTVSTRTPTNGSSAGGTSVTFTGNGLRAATSVTIDGITAPITVRTGAATLATQTNNTSTVTVTMPAGTAGGSRTVVIQTLGGSVESTFTYNWVKPTLTGTVSGTGSASGGASVTLNGANLNGASAVTLGSSATSSTENIVNVSSYATSGTTAVTVIVPPRACGQSATDWFFRVTTPGGTSDGSVNQKFSYSAASSPVISTVSSATALAIGGESIVITGTNFVCVSAVKFGTQPATSYIVNSATQITAVTPAGQDGSTSISVTTDAGTDTNSSLFTFVSAALAPQTQQIVGTVDTAIISSTALTASNFTGAVSYAVSTGSLPAGLLLSSSTGVVSGTPTAASTATVTITASGATAGTASATITFAIVAAPVVTTPAPAVVTPTTAPAVTTTIVATTTTTTTTTTTVPAGAPVLVTAANQAQLEAAPGAAVAVINGKAVEVETVKVEATATPEALQQAAKNIVSDISSVLPPGVKNPIAVVNTPDGAELSGLMVNPDDPTEKLSVPVDSVTLIKAGDSRVLISALNQTNLPGEVAPGGVLQVTRGGYVAAQAFGLPGSETGEIVLMSTPRLLQTFTVNANGSFNGQVALPKNISFGSHTVVMATKSAKVSLGIKLVRTRMQFRIKRVMGTTIFKNRAKVVKRGGGVVSVTGAGRCKANSKRVVMSAKPGACYITVKQKAKGANKAVYYRFTVAVLKKLPKKATALAKK